MHYMFDLFLYTGYQLLNGGACGISVAIILLSNKIGLALQPVFVSKKLEQDLKPKEAKPSIVNHQCVVYHFVCDLWDADYVGYTARHLFQRVAEHKNSAIGKHFHEAHGRRDRLNESHFKILRKCQGNLIV